MLLDLVSRNLRQSHQPDAERVEPVPLPWKIFDDGIVWQCCMACNLAEGGHFLIAKPTYALTHARLVKPQGLGKIGRR